MKFTAKCILLSGIVSFFFLTTIRAQITITSSDMPASGDTIRKSSNLSAFGIDYTLTGENFSWDFSTLFPISQTVDTFVNVGSVPFAYQFVFIPTLVSNLAKKFPEIDTLPQIEITDPYRFFKNSASSYNDVGFALTINSIPIPLKYESPDIIYQFPLSYGQADSSFSGFEYSLPDLGYLSVARKRVNLVDGWGTLNTPFGSHEVIRLTSKVFESDSVYVDSISYGLQIDREYTEYKWLANGFGEPLLQVYEEGPLVQISWIDSLRQVIAGIPEQDVPETEISISPNPCHDLLQIDIVLKSTSMLSMDLFNIGGQKVAAVFEGSPGSGLQQIYYDASYLPEGVYILKINHNHRLSTKKIIIH